MLQRILRRPEVEALTGLSCSTIYERMSLGTFPRAVPLGLKSVGWLEHEVIAWQKARIAERTAKHGQQFDNDIPPPAE